MKHVRRVLCLVKGHFTMTVFCPEEGSAHVYCPRCDTHYTKHRRW